MTFELNKEGRGVNRKRVRRLMRVMGIEALVPRPGTSKTAPGHKICPYLLRGLKIVEPNHVWARSSTASPAVAPVVALQAQSQATKGRELSTLAARDRLPLAPSAAMSRRWRRAAGMWSTRCPRTSSSAAGSGLSCRTRGSSTAGAIRWTPASPATPSSGVADFRHALWLPSRRRRDNASLAQAGSLGSFQRSASLWGKFSL